MVFFICYLRNESSTDYFFLFFTMVSSLLVQYKKSSRNIRQFTVGMGRENGKGVTWRLILNNDLLTHAVCTGMHQVFKLRYSLQTKDKRQPLLERSADFLNLNRIDSMAQPSSRSLYKFVVSMHNFITCLVQAGYQNLAKLPEGLIYLLV